MSIVHALVAIGAILGLTAVAWVPAVYVEMRGRSVPRTLVLGGLPLPAPHDPRWRRDYGFLRLGTGDGHLFHGFQVETDGDISFEGAKLGASVAYYRAVLRPILARELAERERRALASIEGPETQGGER